MNSLKLKIAQFLESIAKANQESFGNRPLSCCTLEKREIPDKQKP